MPSSSRASTGTACSTNHVFSSEPEDPGGQLPDAQRIRFAEIYTEKLTRPHDAVQWAPLPHAGCALLDACAAGATFEDAAAQALQADPAADLPALVALLLHSGALRAPETSLN